MPRRRNRSGADDSRRTFLKASGAGAVALSLAGCSGNSGDDSTPSDSKNNGGDDNKTSQEKASKAAVTADDIKPGGTFRYGMSTAPDTPNVMLSGSVYSAAILSSVYDYGIESDPVTFETKPSVFTDWKLKNGDKKKPDVYFNARDKGLKWNDGEKFTPEDILYSFQFQLDNEPGQFTCWQHFEKIEEAKNDWDFHVKLSNQVGTWDTTILGAPPMIPKHIWSKLDDYQKYDPTKKQDEGPVGTGPGKLVKWNPDTSMQVKFRRDYIENDYAINKLDWKKDHKSIIAGGPFLDTINYKVYGTEAAMTQAFLNGEIDTHYGSMDAAKIPKVKKTDGLSLVHGFSSGFDYCGFNCRNSPLDDVTFRQAMSFMWDDFYWTNSLHGGFYIKGDYPQAPGYSAVRPESVYGGDLLTDPRTNAFDFRGIKGSKKPDVDAVRKFMTDGNVLDGSKGTYAGKKYPGSFSGVTASQSKAKYKYTFGPVKSSVLKNSSVDVDKEIRVDGKTVSEMMGKGGVTLFMDPPGQHPKGAKSMNQWKKNLHQLGIPCQVKPVAFNTMTGLVYKQEKYDVYPMGWGGTSPYGTSLYSFFDSKNSGDDTDAFAYNSTGYGVAGGSSDKLLEKAYKETDPKKRNKLYAKAMEKIYFDSPYMVQSYEKYRWPVNSQKFGGFIQNIVDPAYASWSNEWYNIYVNDNVKK